MADEYLLTVEGVSKHFPGVKALDRVNFNLRAGEVNALLGENGAGKSTFIKVITGVHQPDEGVIRLHGEEVRFDNSLEALHAGIIAVYQHMTNFGHLSVTENIYMGHEEVSPRTKRILWKKMNIRAQEILDELGANFKASTRLSTLSIAQKQLVEIAKALSVESKLLIMDEPTASLTLRESEDLYKIVDTLRAKGVGVIFISHRFEDIERLADQVTVFRDGKYINSWKQEDVSKKELIFAMVGREVTQLYPERNVSYGNEVLRVEHLSKTGVFKDVSFDVCRGEVLGITGLIGAGRTEVVEALMGITHLEQGAIYLEGEKNNIRHPSTAFQKGIVFLPEDRQLQGLLLDWDLVRNITLSSVCVVAKNIWTNYKKEIDTATPLVEKLEVKTKSVFVKAKNLSGGNQQKVVLSKLLVGPAKVIIVDEPTKGVDIGAKSAIYKIIRTLANEGYAIIMISSEIPEILGMSDRFIVMTGGRVAKVFKNEEGITQEMILEAAMPKRSAATS